jgi:hypothetical protein
MINLYQYHTNPKELENYNNKHNYVWQAAMEKADQIGVEKFYKQYPQAYNLIANQINKGISYIVGNYAVDLLNRSIFDNGSTAYDYARKLFFDLFPNGLIKQND